MEECGETPAKVYHLHIFTVSLQSHAQWPALFVFVWAEVLLSALPLDILLFVLLCTPIVWIYANALPYQYCIMCCLSPKQIFWLKCGFSTSVVYTKFEKVSPATAVCCFLKRIRMHRHEAFVYFCYKHWLLTLVIFQGSEGSDKHPANSP